MKLTQWDICSGVEVKMALFITSVGVMCRFQYGKIRVPIIRGVPSFQRVQCHDILYCLELGLYCVCLRK